MKKEDMILMCVIIVGIAIITVPSFTSVPDSVTVEVIRPFYAYIGIIYVPVGLSLSNVLMRKMKGLHFIQLSVFKLFVSIPIAGFVLALSRPSWEVFAHFGYVDWIILVASAVVQQGSVVGRFLSFKFASPSKLAHYTYLTSFYSFIFDLTIPLLMAHFDVYNYTGIGIILFGFAMKFLVVGRRLKAAKEDEKKKFK